MPQPTTTADAVDDLRAVLTAAEIDRPIVLVGHSYGGIVSRLYAAIHPDDVVGMVLVDSLSPELRAQMSGDEWEIWKVANERTAEQIADYPELERLDVDAALDQGPRGLSHRSPATSSPDTSTTVGAPCPAHSTYMRRPPPTSTSPANASASSANPSSIRCVGSTGGSSCSDPAHAVSTTAAAHSAARIDRRVMATSSPRRESHRLPAGIVVGAPRHVQTRRTRHPF